MLIKCSCWLEDPRTEALVELGSLQASQTNDGGIWNGSNGVALEQEETWPGLRSGALRTTLTLVVREVQAEGGLVSFYGIIWGAERFAGRRGIQRGEGTLRPTWAWAAGCREPNKGTGTWNQPSGKGVASGSCPEDPRASAGKIQRGKPNGTRGQAMTILGFLLHGGPPHTSWLSFCLVLPTCPCVPNVAVDSLRPRALSFEMRKPGSLPMPDHSREA